jgi:Secretion system C-terminal sorting domain
VRWRLAGSNSTLSSGNDRYDNFSVLGDVTTGEQNVSASSGYSVYPNPAIDLIHIISDNYAAEKTITLYNILGEVVFSNVYTGKLSSLNTAGLSNGVYFIEIKEIVTGNKYTMKVVKE